MVSIRYHDTVKFLQGMIDTPPSPFARFEWLQLLEESGCRPLVVSSERGGEIVALPLVQDGAALKALTNWYNFTWHPAGKYDADALADIAADLRSRSHHITLSPLANETGEATALETAFRTAGWKVVLEQCDHNHILRVQGRSFAEYWADRPGKMRTTLKRKAKKVEVEILTTFDADMWAAYETIYQNSWKPEEGDPALLRKFAEQEGAAGRIRLAIARYEGAPVAAQFWTVENGTAYIHKLAHLEEHTTLSAGTTLSAALFEHVIDTDRVELVDFGTGNDRYKADWMEEVRPRFRLDCLDPRQPKAWPVLAKRIIRRVAPKARQS